MGKGINRDLPQNANLKRRAKELRKAGNLSETLLWLQIKKWKINGLDFDRQVVIENYIVDFYCAEKRLVIEIDGESHDFKGDDDKKRDELLKGLGLTVIHIPNMDVKRNMDGVIQYIKQITAN